MIAIRFKTSHGILLYLQVCNHVCCFWLFWQYNWKWQTRVLYACVAIQYCISNSANWLCAALQVHVYLYSSERTYYKHLYTVHCTLTYSSLIAIFVITKNLYFASSCRETYTFLHYLNSLLLYWYCTHYCCKSTVDCSGTWESSGKPAWQFVW